MTALVKSLNSREILQVFLHSFGENLSQLLDLLHFFPSGSTVSTPMTSDPAGAMDLHQNSVGPGDALIQSAVSIRPH